MTAYIIAIKQNTKDQSELDLYRSAASKAVTADQKPLVVYGDFEVLEGASHEGMVILEFPDTQAARAWYDSDAYQAAKRHRVKGGDYQFTLIEGFAGLPGRQASA
jgi:uncharacterized protein (DUF1330 family)